jgi:hypothetical protein
VGRCSGGSRRAICLARSSSGARRPTAFLAARRIFEPLRGTTLFDEIELAVTKLTSLARRPGRGPNAGLADAELERRFLYLPHAPKDYSQKVDELDELFQRCRI